MKVTYLERIERHRAFFQNMYCPACRGRNYEIVEQLEPKCYNNWYVRCPQCGAESVSGPTRDVAIARWKRNKYANNVDVAIARWEQIC